MARRLLTPDGIFCSACGTAGEATADLCYSCGQPFEGEVPGTKCPQCGRAVDEQDGKCPTCGSDLPRQTALAEAPIPTAELIKEIKAFRQGTREALGPLEKATSAMPEETEAGLLAELESLWKLSEPFEKVVAARRKRIEQMDKLIAAARRRVRELEASGNPTEVREREELKKQVQEVLLERDEILKIEFGITEMERIYRNIITMQQKELRAKEDALKARLEGFRKEIGMRDQERTALVDRETELARKEKELEQKMTEFEGRMKSIGSAAGSPAGEPTEPGRDGSDSGVTREQWLAAQKEIQDALLKLRGTGGEIILPTAVSVRDLRMRLTELEESIEKIAGEKNDLEAELERLKASEDHVRGVLKEVDELLAKLPDGEIKKFARSEAFKKYEALMERLGL